MNWDRLSGLIKQYWAWLSERQWSYRELLAAAGLVVLILVLIVIRRWRKEAAWMQEYDGTAEDGLENKGTPSVSLLQREIARRSRIESSLEREISDLNHANEQLKDNIAELKNANEKIKSELRHDRESFEKKIAELKAEKEHLQREIADNKKAEKLAQREIDVLTSDNVPLHDKVSELTRDNQKLRQAKEASEHKVVELIVANEHLLQDVAETKKKQERTNRHIADLTAVNKQLLHKLAERTVADGRQEYPRNKEGMPMVVSPNDTHLRTKSAAQQIRELLEEIAELNAQKGTSDGPDAKREAVLEACNYIDADNTEMAIESLKKLIHSVEAQNSESNGGLRKEDAEDLIYAARGIIDLLTAQSALVDAD